MSDFWKGKKVFLTGHTGFKGGWLTLWLSSLGAKVHGYALGPPTPTNFYSVANIHSRLASNIVADVRDSSTLARGMMQIQPDIIFHMAAQPLVRQSYNEPVETYATNVMGTVNLLEAVRKTSSVKAVVNVTTDKCYENREWVWSYRENEAMGGYDPYSSSKGCAELITAAYRQSFLANAGVAVASARAGNVIGGGDWAIDRLLPDVLRSIENGRPAAIRNPYAIRPWQYVLEPLNGYLQLAQKLFEDGLEYAEGWNFGPSSEDAKPVRWLVEQIVSQWGEGANWQLDDTVQLHEANSLKLDSSKAQSRLGWRPKWTLIQALEQVVSWQKAHLGGVDMEEFSLEQIANFQRTIKR
ncbi:CDP-glucose 4,6-dehydratase [Pseudomonadales bacterium]|nr:CDP-glucose 4,6-dehydratase [Pseudomonadales bacterium]